MQRTDGNWVVWQNANIAVRVQLLNKDNTAVDLSGATVLVKVADKLTSEVLFSVTVSSHTTPLEGITVIPLSAAQLATAGEYVYQFFVTKANAAAPGGTETIPGGVYNFIIKKSV